jgi:hypothetical protein
MRIPGFTAEASLHQTAGEYQTDRHAIQYSREMSSAVYPSAQGQDFPGTTCTCQGCGSGGGDVTGQCGSVCKGKTVYAKGSLPHDYCKASDTGLVRPPGLVIYLPDAWGGALSEG